MKQLVYKFKVNIGVEIGNYQWKELLLIIFQTKLNQESSGKYEFHSYISDENEQD